MLGVAGRFQEVREEEASLFRLAVTGEHAVALAGKAAFHLTRGVVVFLFTDAEKTAVLFALVSPAHAGATVELADAATRNHDVELALLNVATDVCRHDDELLALLLECLGVCVGGAVVAFTREGELVAVTALATVTCGNCREGEPEFVAAVNGERDLASAGHEAAAAADTSATPVGAFGFALVGALPCGISAGVFLPGTAGLAAVPVTGCPAASAGATALVLDSRAAACGGGGAALHAAGRLHTAGGLHAAGRGLLDVAGRGLLDAAGRNDEDVARGFGHAGTRFRSLRELVARGEHLESGEVADGAENCAGTVRCENLVRREIEETGRIAVDVGDDTELAFGGGVDDVFAVAFAVQPGSAHDGVNLSVGLKNLEGAHVDGAVDDGVAVEILEHADVGAVIEIDSADDIALGVGYGAVRIDDVIDIRREKPCGGCYGIFRITGTDRFFGAVPSEQECACDK